MAFLRLFPGLAWVTGDEVYDMRFELWDGMRRQVEMLLDD